jgi:hypothetical protein
MFALLRDNQSELKKQQSKFVSEHIVDKRTLLGRVMQMIRN